MRKMICVKKGRKGLLRIVKHTNAYAVMRYSLKWKMLVHSSGTRSDQILFDGSVRDDFWSLQEDNMLDASQIIASFPTFLLSEEDQTSSDVTVSPDEKSPSQNHMLIYKTEPFESN